MDSNHFWKWILVPDWNQKSDNLQYNTLGRWDKQLINQASDVQSIIFFSKFLCKNHFNLFSYFYNFTKIKIKSFECPKSIRSYEKK